MRLGRLLVTKWQLNGRASARLKVVQLLAPRTLAGELDVGEEPSSGKIKPQQGAATCGRAPAIGKQRVTTVGFHFPASKHSSQGPRRSGLTMCVRYTEGMPGYLMADLRGGPRAHEGDIVVSVST